MSEAELQPEPPAMPLNVAGPAFEALRVLWEAGSSCDVTLRAGSGSKEVLIPCHRCARRLLMLWCCRGSAGVVAPPDS